MGTRPSLVPLVPLIGAPLARTPLTWMPIPPPYLLILAHLVTASKMPSMLSSSTPVRKQDASCWRLSPALNSVGEACVNLPVLRYS